MVLVKSKPEINYNEGFFPSSLQSMFNAFFDDASLKSQHVGFVPQSDIVESKENYEIRMSLPGVKKEDVKISIEDNMLKIEGERKHELTEDKGKFVRREMSYGKFSRSFNIGKMDASMIEAGFENGMLSISIPKIQEKKTSTVNIK